MPLSAVRSKGLYPSEIYGVLRWWFLGRQYDVNRRPVWRMTAVSSASYTRPSRETCSMRDFRGSSAARDEAIAGAISVMCRSSGRRIQSTRCRRLGRSAGGVKHQCRLADSSFNDPSCTLSLSLVSSRSLRCGQKQKCAKCVQT